MHLQWQFKRDGAWEYLMRVDKRPAQTETGKYLFFSVDRVALLEIARREIILFGFFDAKVSMRLKGDEYALCLYWHDDSRKHELAARNSTEYGVKYRWWKSNEQTIQNAVDRGDPLPCGWPASWHDLDDPNHPDPGAAGDDDRGEFDYLLMDKDWF